MIPSKRQPSATLVTAVLITTAAAGLAALLPLSLTSSAISAAAKPAASAPIVSGTLTVNGTTTKIRYGYARLVKGFFDPKKNDVEIVLSDVPLDEATLSDSSTRDKLGHDGKLHAFEITLNASGTPVSTSFRHEGFSGPSPSGLDSSDVFAKKSITAKAVDARYTSSAEHEFFGDTYSFAVSFRLAIAPRKK